MDMYVSVWGGGARIGCTCSRDILSAPFLTPPSPLLVPRQVTPFLIPLSPLAIGPPPQVIQSDVDEALRLMRMSKASLNSDMEPQRKEDNVSVCYK